MNKSGNKIALVDFDSLYYSCSKETLAESLQLLDERFESLLKEVDADYYVGFNSYSPYFRHKVDLEYKSTRTKYKSPLKWLKTLRGYSQEMYNIQSQKGVEADDLVAYFNGQTIYEGMLAYSDGTSGSGLSVDKDHFIEEEPIIVESVICSADKDVLNLQGKAFDMKKWIWVETTRNQEEYVFWTSMIAGDNADSIKGIPGKGPAFAKKLFLGLNDDATAIRNLVFEEYMNYFGEYLGVIEFGKNYKLLKMLNTWDSYRYNDLSEPQLKNIMKVSEVFNNNNQIEVEF